MSKNKLKTIPKKRWDTMKALMKDQFKNRLPTVDYFIVTRPKGVSAKHWKELCTELTNTCLANDMACCVSEADKPRKVKQVELLCSATGERAHCTNNGEPVALINCCGLKHIAVCEHHLAVHLSHSNGDLVILKWLKTDFRG
jgi:hypothetical protein